MHPFSGSQLKVYINKTREQIKQAKRNGLRREDLKPKRNKARIFPG